MVQGAVSYFISYLIMVVDKKEKITLPNQLGKFSCPTSMLGISIFYSLIMSLFWVKFHPLITKKILVIINIKQEMFVKQYDPK